MVKQNKIPAFHNPLRSESEAAYDKKMAKPAIGNCFPGKIKKNADGDTNENTENMEGKTLAQSGAIFGKRLDLLNDYLVRESNEDTRANKPFSAFLVFKGVSPEEFAKDLPAELKTIPDTLDDTLHYAQLLHDYYSNLYVQYLREQAGLSADGELNLEDDVKTYDTHHTVNADGKKACCKSCAEHSANGLMTYDQPLIYADGSKKPCCSECAKKHHSATGSSEQSFINQADNNNAAVMAKAGFKSANGYSDQAWEDQVNDNIAAVDPKVGFYANASGVTICPLPPIRPLSPRGSGGLGGLFKKQIAANWATYDKNKAKFDACIKKKNTELYNLTHPKKSEDGGLSPALHTFNLTNPVLVLAWNAYLLLLKLNVAGWATTWSRLQADPDQSYWKKAYAVFYNIGGNEEKLKAAINTGKGKKPIFKRKNGQFNSDGGAAEAMTAAAGIIAALGGILTAYMNAKGKTSAEQAPADIDDAALRGDPNAPGGDSYDAGDSGESSTDPGVSNGMSTSMKLLIGFGIGIPLAVGAFFGIRYIVKNS